MYVSPQTTDLGKAKYTMRSYIQHMWIGAAHVAVCGLVSRAINPYPLDEVTTVLRAHDVT